ncbi:radical SAM protein [Sodalinema gerasimenkoae]|uniref:radical SAM protein n=1 Tax=Sodalinema gerasimenkoae TaxID=2862348 RepID=UPI00135B68AE|nr:radical SAM protein [Sodalinema gerasimenkoae]
MFSPIYGPVTSWRYGTSLGIDLIGEVSTCSFDCAYCQLGEIERKTQQRQIFVPTADLIEALNAYSPWPVDIVTFSGSGEPTLAENLGEAIAAVKALTQKPVLVLSNATLLNQPEVRAALNQADRVSLKLDAPNPDLLRRINRPVEGVSWEAILEGLQRFRRDYPGIVDIQTMLLSPWKADEQQAYQELIAQLHPHEIQLNTPTRPKPVGHQLDGRGNHSQGDRPYAVRQLKSVSREVLQDVAEHLQQAIAIPVRYAPSPK